MNYTKAKGASARSYQNHINRTVEENFILPVLLHNLTWFTNIIQLQITADKSVIASRGVDIYVTDTPLPFSKLICLPFLLTTYYAETYKIDTQR